MEARIEKRNGFVLVVLVMPLTVVLVFSARIEDGFSASEKEIPKEVRIGDVLSYMGPYAGFGSNSFRVEAAV